MRFRPLILLFASTAGLAYCRVAEADKSLESAEATKPDESTTRESTTPEPAESTQSTGLTVETGSPDALCPDLSATRQAVHDRIGQLTLEGDRWMARYTIGH